MDTRWWNLSLGVMATSAMTACGPTIILEEGETDGVVTDSDGPETMPPGTTTPPVECLSQSDCEPGFTCIDNACIPYDDYYCADGCCDGGCCYDDCCYDGYGEDCYYGGCYDDEQCGFASLCGDFGECESVDVLPYCDEPGLAELPLPPGDDDGGIISLSFVDADGDGREDLLVGRTSGAELYMGGGEASPVDVPMPQADDVLVDAVGGDFDGDGDTDLAVTDGDDGLSILLGDGTGAFTPGFTVDITDPVIELSGVDWNGDGALDLVGRTAAGSVVVHVGDGAGSLVAHLALLGLDDAQSYAVGRFDEDAASDVVVQAGGQAMIYAGNEDLDVSVDRHLGSENFDWDRWLLADDLDGGGLADILGGSNKPGWVLLEAWRDGGESPTRHALDLNAEFSEIGDYDGDGVLDLVIAGIDHLSLVRGSPQDASESVVQCQTYVEVGLTIDSLAVGDLDGDGRDEIVVSRESEFYVFTAL